MKKEKKSVNIKNSSKKIENKKSEKKDNKKIFNEKNKKKSKKKVVLITIFVLIFVVLILFISSYYLKNYAVKNIKIISEQLNKVEISFEENQNTSTYVVIYSNTKFTINDVEEQIKENNLSKWQNIKIAKNNFVIDNLKLGTTYYLCIIPYTEENNYKEPSNVVKFKTKTNSFTISNLSSRDISDKSVTLTWDQFDINKLNLDKNDVSISYNLYKYENNKKTENKLIPEKKVNNINTLYNPNPYSNYKLIEENIEDNNYTIENLEPCTNYKFIIKLNLNIDKLNYLSNNESSIELMTKPSKINNLKTSNDKNSITLTWDNYDIDNLKESLNNSNIEVKYSVYASDSLDGEYTLIADKISENTFTENSLDEGKTRYYYVYIHIIGENIELDSMPSDIINATTDITPINNYTSNYSYNYSYNNSTDNNTYNNTSNYVPGLNYRITWEKYNQAYPIAQSIANSVTGDTDLEKIKYASYLVGLYMSKGYYTMSGSDYYTAYGLFIKGEYSCAGTTRALLMVLQIMGYNVHHINENQYTHQWVEIDNMDGERGWADAMLYDAGYGNYPF